MKRGKDMKKIIATILCAVTLASQAVSVSAFKFPNSFWAPNGKYETAMNTGNHQDIITYGKQLVDILLGCPDAPEKIDALIGRYNQIAHAYEALGDYENSGVYYKHLYDLASSQGEKYLDYVKGGLAKYPQYTPRMALYTNGGSGIYYGEKNEPQWGTLFGLCQDGETRSSLSNESLILTYQELGTNIAYYHRNALDEAKAKGISVEFALNCPREAADIYSVQYMEGYLQELSDFLREYPDVRVFLRFAAEFDVWTNMAEPDAFCEAFRYVSRFFKDRNPNVSIVWSPNQVAGYYVNIDDFYPGDEYVDWVGISLYSTPYFLGDKWSSHDNQVFFHSGDAANPVISVENIVKKYGTKKPIIISESGCGHRLLSDGEDTTAFAVKKLREQLSYLPMVYPQIKAMAYFDNEVRSWSEKYDFRLSSNSQMRDTYVELTKGAHFIQGSDDSSKGGAYRQIADGTVLNGKFPVSCFAHKFGKEVTKVEYYLGGELVATAYEAPYTAEIDGTQYKGNHSLRAVAFFNDGSYMEQKFGTVLNGEKNEITVEVAGSELSFDQPPVIENGRTMVPMRGIFEALGANVEWDASTKTAIGTKGDIQVRITVGDAVMYVNGVSIQLDAPAMIVSGRTLVPARAIAEGLGCSVEWNGKTKTVIIK